MWTAIAAIAGTIAAFASLATAVVIGVNAARDRKERREQAFRAILDATVSGLTQSNECTLTIRNTGPWLALDVAVRVRAPANAADQGEWYFSRGQRGESIRERTIKRLPVGGTFQRRIEWGYYAGATKPSPPTAVGVEITWKEESGRPGSMEVDVEDPERTPF